MPTHMSMPWYMGGFQWMELLLFWFVVLAVTVVLITRLAKSGKPSVRLAISTSGWRNWPEIRLIMLALPLELLWEIAQFPLYDVWHNNDWGYILYGLAHCTLGDLLILLVIYEIVAVLNRNRYWPTKRLLINSFSFTIMGVGYTIYSEIVNVHIKGTWGYTDLMPLIPGLEIGGMPFLQWLLIPPVLLWLVRQTDSVVTAKSNIID